MCMTSLPRAAALLALAVVATPPSRAAYWLDVVLTSLRVAEINGDLDGYPDTNETFDLFLGVSNKSDDDLTGVVVRIETDDPKIDCIDPATVVLGPLSAHSDADLPSAFRLHVRPEAERGGPAVSCLSPGPSGTCSNFVPVAGGCLLDDDCRLTVNQDYAARITVTISSDQFEVQRRPQALTLDLDLNSDHPAIATSTFSEGFESGFGTVLPQNLDDFDSVGYNNTTSDGYRCQYNDPDFPNSQSYGETYCYLGFYGQNPLNDWHVHDTGSPDGGRAYLGANSLHWGKHLDDDPGMDTTSLSQLDAILVKYPLHLAARVCRDDPAADKRACAVDSDCTPVGGGPCVSASPELSFKHQISLVDDRSAAPWGESTDRAVVSAQLAATSSLWTKIDPFENVYDVQGTDNLVNCKFDPIDDGSTEDDFFDPSDPDRRLGPSSTCFPEFVFAYLGDTDAAFDADEIGKASDPPGLPGSLGPGTWVESRFDLSRYRGRSIKLRWLVTTIKNQGDQTAEDVFRCNPIPDDDGWYVDDVLVSGTLGLSAPTVTLDLADNGSLLPGNIDGDALGDDCDCAPADAGVFAVPAEVAGLTVDADRVTLTWDSAAPAAGSATLHDVLRGALDELPVGAGGAETCIDSEPGTTTGDPALPDPGKGYWYLVRGRNACAAGTYGFEFVGPERISAVCP